MAVGAVSSARNLGATTPTAPILSGEKIATTEAALRNPAAKTYYHQVSGAKFVMPNGLEVVFLGGRITTADKAIQEQLDAIANKSASLVFTRKEGVEIANAQDKRVADDAALSAKTDSEVK